MSHLRFKRASQSLTAPVRRQLGGELPPSIEIRCPAMDSRVKIDIPSSVSLDTDEGVAMFTRQNMVALCRTALKKYRDWEFIIERELDQLASSMK